MAKRKSQKKNNEFDVGFGMGDMGDIGFGNSPAPRKSRGSRRSNNEFDVGFGMGNTNMNNIGIPTTDNEAMGFGNSPAPTNDFGGIGSFNETGFDDAPQPQRQQPQNNGGFDMSNMFGGNQNQKERSSVSNRELASNVRQFTHRGKQMVEDPENPNHLIKLSTYKKRYGNSNVPKRKSRNNVGNRNIGQQTEWQQAFGEMKETGRVAKKVATEIRTRLKADRAPMMEVEQQPETLNQKLKEQRDVEPIRYSVDIVFSDGSQTQIITKTYTEAQTRQRSIKADPDVRSATINPI